MKGFRFVVFGDSKGKKDGINEKVLRKIMERVKELRPQADFIVTLGDMVAGSENISELKYQLLKFKKLINEYCPLKTIYPIVGNHEVANKPADDTYEKVFKDVYTDFVPDGCLENYNRTVYYVDNFNTRLIFLNSFHYGEINKIDNLQLGWLRNTAKTNIEHKIVFVHSPAYPTGAHIKTCLDSYPDERDKFWKVIDENNITAVFSGHEHNYSRRIIDSKFNTESYIFNRSIHQIITGGGGEKLKDKFKDKRGIVIPPKDVYNFVVVDVSEGRIYVNAMTVSGRIIDSFILGNK